MEHENSSQRADTILLPAPTAWPMILAFAVALIFAGLVTNYGVSIVGLIIFIRASVGWWYEVLPHERHEASPVKANVAAALEAPAVSRRIERLQVGEESHRVRIPAEIKPYSSGIKGGLVGAVAMAAVALLYGIISQGSIWYPINLLAAAAVPDLATASVEQLRQFNALGLGLGALMHIAGSILVGLLYAVTLPMFPRRAWLWAGIISPILWSGLIASALSVMNPALNARIDWAWFVASQLAFGVIGGYVVARSESIDTMQSWSLVMRTGIEAPDTMRSSDEGKNSK